MPSIRTYPKRIKELRLPLGISPYRGLFRIMMVLACVVSAAGAFGTPTAKSFKNKKGFTWISKSSLNFNYYFEPGTPAERDFEKISDRMEKSRANVEKLLGGSFGEKTDSFIVDSRARMKQLVGEEGNGFAFGSVNPTTSRTEFVTAMVYSDTIKAIGAHETCHALSHLFGESHTAYGWTKAWPSTPTINGTASRCTRQQKSCLIKASYCPSRTCSKTTG
jgi:hypothetical protein